jgi:hypothetical protein
VLDAKKLQQFLKKAVDELDGDWVLIGGTVLPALGVDHRVTVDIDLVPLSSQGNDEMLSLMNLAESIGLPVESINSVGVFSLKKILGFERELVLLCEGKSARIFRPQFFLYLKLKYPRLSESDLDDLLMLLKFSRKNGDVLDIKSCLKWIDDQMKKQNKDMSESRLRRIEKLKSQLLIRD